MTATNDEIYRAIGRLEGTLKTFMDQMAVQDNRTSAIEARLRVVESNTDIENRIRRVENRQYWLSGAGSIIGMLLGALGIHIK